MTGVKIKYISDGGIAGKERLILAVTAADDMGQYLIFSTKETAPGHISSTPKNVYWFPDKPVRAGDLVVLYTRSGEQSQVSNKNGTTTHFFYWGLGGTIWNNPNDSAAILKVEQWDYKSKG